MWGFFFFLTPSQGKGRILLAILSQKKKYKLPKPISCLVKCAYYNKVNMGMNPA